MAIDYSRNHRNPTNLLIHMVAVPMFVSGALIGVWQLIAGRLIVATVFLLLMPVSLALQGAGHKLEEHPPEPFNSPWDFLQRIFAEQFFRFWKFVFSGAWFEAYSRSLMSGGEGHNHESDDD